jgi:hypothetical protein
VQIRITNRFGRIFILFFLCVWGCASDSSANLAPLAHLVDPVVHTYRDPELDVTSYSTFAIVPASSISKDTHLSGLLEKQILFSLRSGLETRGYRFVSSAEAADFIVTIDGFSEYREKYIPPQLVTVPVWTPGRTITHTGSDFGTIYGKRGSATYQGTYSGETRVPGHLGYQTQARPGYTVGAHYPSVMVLAYDLKKQRMVWEGSSTGATTNSDLRISSQLLLAKSLEQLPMCKKAASHYPMKRNLGATCGIFTLDGSTYFPVIGSVDEKSIAARAGLRSGDIILQIKGQDASNKPFSEIVRMVAGDEGPLMVKVKRPDRVVDLQI